MREIIDTVTPEVLLEERALYEADEHVWIEQQIDALQEGSMAKVDRVNLIEYLSDVTSRDKSKLESRLIVLLQHLLKVTYQPQRISKSWGDTIAEQQDRITIFLKNIPSLGRQAPGYLITAYPRAVRNATRQTGLVATTFPVACPWTLDEALSFDPPAPVAGDTVGPN